MYVTICTKLIVMTVGMYSMLFAILSIASPIKREQKWWYTHRKESCYFFLQLELLMYPWNQMPSLYKTKLKFKIPLVNTYTVIERQNYISNWICYPNAFKYNIETYHYLYHIVDCHYWKGFEFLVYLLFIARYPTIVNMR